MNYVDQLNRLIKLEYIPKRIVSLVPSQTELLVDLGLGPSIVGVTKFCIHPESLKEEKEVVGGTKQVHFDKIKALNPDIILCNKEENTKDMISELEKMAPVHISDVFNLDDALELIEMYGVLFSVEKNAEGLIQNIKNEYQEFCKYIEEQPKLKVAYFIWKTPWMVAANHTFINEMLQLNNFENHFRNLERYPEINLETLTGVDVVMLSSEPFPFNEEHIEMLSHNFPNTKVILVDGEYFSWYGSRLKDAFKYFKTLRHNLLS